METEYQIRNAYRNEWIDAMDFEVVTHLFKNHCPTFTSH